MVLFYQQLCAQFHWPVDIDWVKKATKESEEKIKELDEKIDDATKNLGETEVRETNLAKAEYYCKIGDKVFFILSLKIPDLLSVPLFLFYQIAAEQQFRVTTEKTVALGQKLDITFALIRLGFFFNDKELTKRNIEKAKNQIDQGGDWDRRNRLRVYEAYYLLSIRQFYKAADLFIESLPSFTSDELFSFEKCVYYTVMSSIVSLDRVSLKKRVYITF